MGGRASARHFKVDPIPTEGTSDLSNLPVPPCLVDGLIPKGAIIIVSAKMHSGKTFFAAELARALALKTPWGGHFPVPRGESTLFVEQDAPKIDTGRVMWAMVRKDWQKPEEYEVTGVEHQPLDAIRFLWHQGFNLWDGRDGATIIATANSVRFSHGFEQGRDPIYDEAGDISGYREYSEEVERPGVGLIIIDSLRSMHAARENESDDMEPIMQDLKYMRAQTGATILILHHENADGTKARGSTAIEAAADLIFSLSRKQDSNIITCKVTKGRIIQPESFKFQILSEEDEDGKVTKSVTYLGPLTPGHKEEPSTKMTPDNFLAYLGSRNGTTRAEALAWFAMNGLSVPTLGNWISTLKKQGAIRVERNKDGSTYFSA